MLTISGEEPPSTARIVRVHDPLDGRSSGVDKVGKVHRAPECMCPRVPGKNLKINFPVQWVKLLADLQIWGCELHNDAIGGLAPAGPAAGL